MCLGDDYRERLSLGLVPEQIGNLGKEGTVRSLKSRSRKEHLIDEVPALKTVIVAQKHHGSCIDAIR